MLARRPTAKLAPRRRGTSPFVTLVVVVAMTAAIGACSRIADRVLVPVSRSNPSPGAMAALDSCGITNFDPDRPHSLLNLGIDVVSGMALITPGRDANKYAPLGNSPDIKTDKPAWVITTTGWLTLGVFSAGPAENPTCVVVAEDWDNVQWYLTGNQMIDDNLVTPGPQPSALFSLPSLTP